MEGLASPALDHSPAHGLNASTRRPGAMAVSGGGGSGATGSISPFRTSRDGELSPAKRVLRWEHAWSGACMFAWAEGGGGSECSAGMSCAHVAAVAETSYMTKQVISPRRPLGRLRVRASGGGGA